MIKINADPDMRIRLSLREFRTLLKNITYMLQSAGCYLKFAARYCGVLSDDRLPLIDMQVKE
jgi:hypothetical protein